MGIESIPAPTSSRTYRRELWAVARASLRAQSWLPTRNPFVVFGLAWGLPVPLVTLSIACAAQGLPIAPQNLVHVLAESPWQWLFMLHPLVFAGVFGSIGTVASDRAAELDRMVEQLKGLADTDGLTGLFNHRSFQSRLREECARAEREGHPIALLMADIDHFKRINDAHGHPVGDQVLKELARRILQTVRPYDIVARYGGEEFAIILPGLDTAAAGQTAERVRLAVGEQVLAIEELEVPVTVSIGVAMHEKGQPVEDWIARADACLYASKQAGRNRTTAPPPSPPPA